MQHILTGNSLPTQAPQYIGQEYFDKASSKFYIATSTGVDGWQILGAGSDNNSNSYVTAHLEGPMTHDITTDSKLYKLHFSGPGVKTINLPIETDTMHNVTIYGFNTEGSNVTVNIGNNVSWQNGSAPIFPASGNLVEVEIFTLDAGDSWYGKYLSY